MENPLHAADSLRRRQEDRTRGAGACPQRDRQEAQIDPEKYGQRLHSPLHGLYKLKSSHVRIAYHVEKARREVWILMIGDRRDIWDEEQSEILERLGIQRQQADREAPG